MDIVSVNKPQYKLYSLLCKAVDDGEQLEDTTFTDLLKQLSFEQIDVVLQLVVDYIKSKIKIWQYQ